MSKLYRHPIVIVLLMLQVGLLAILAGLWYTSPLAPQSNLTKPYTPHAFCQGFLTWNQEKIQTVLQALMQHHHLNSVEILPTPQGFTITAQTLTDQNLMGFIAHIYRMKELPLHITEFNIQRTQALNDHQLIALTQGQPTALFQIHMTIEWFHHDLCS